MSFLADEDVPDPVINALLAVRFRIQRVAESGVTPTGDRGVMERALQQGDILITCDMGIPSQAYLYEYAKNWITVVTLRWKGRTNRDLQQMVVAILRDAEQWEQIAASSPSVTSVRYQGSRSRRWTDIPEEIIGRRNSGDSRT